MPLLTRRNTPRAPIELIVGAMNFGKRTDEAESHRIVHRALERGVTHFDTANAYTGGLSEEILGRALSGRHEDVVIETKVGLLQIGGTQSGLLQSGGTPEGLSAERIRAVCDESRRRLGVDVLDVYYLHVPDRSVPITESLTAMAELIESGKIRSFAVSNYASWQVLEMIQWCDAHAVPRPLLAQQIYNLLVRQLDIEYLRFAAAYDLITAVYNPLAGGLLTDREVSAQPLAGSRLDGNAMYQGRYGSERMRARVREYQALARSLGMSLVDLSYAWLASREGIDAIVIGPASVEHLDAAIDACERRLDPTLMARIDALHLAQEGSDATYARL
jgi:aryl-alcohol dehydrogenase-like predicted oxidoreductase